MIYTGYRFLPSAYQQVSYIENTAYSYIDTGYTPTQDCSFEGIFYTENTNIDMPLYGCRGDGSSGGYNRQYILWRNPTNGRSPSSIHNNVTINTSYGVALGEKHTFLASNTEFVYDGNQWARGSATYNPPATTLTLFALHSNYSGEESIDVRRFVGRFYGFVIRENDVVVMDLVPCYRKSDRVAGMFDVVTRTFFTNKGSGSFVIGETVNNDLIFDRTEANVQAIRNVISKYLNGEPLTLAEQDLWNSDAKGCLNPSDLNRWGNAMNTIATSLTGHGYSVTANAKTNWANTDYMSQALNEAIINKLHELYTALNDLFIEEGNLRAVFGGGQQTGLTTLPVSYGILAEPSWASLDLVDVDVNTLDYSTINDWNAIERFLYDALDFLDRIGG